MERIKYLKIRVFAIFLALLLMLSLFASCNFSTASSGGNSDTSDDKDDNDKNDDDDGKTDDDDGKTDDDDGKTDEDDGKTDEDDGKTDEDDGKTDDDDSKTDEDDGKTDEDDGKTDDDDSKTDEDDGKTDDDDKIEEPDNLIYNSTSELYLIIDPTVTSSYVSEFAAELSYVREKVVNYAAVDSELHAHEIVIGNTDRAISKTARDRMARWEKNSEDEFLFFIYSNGSSIAIVWEEADEGITAELAIKYAYENLINESLIAAPGEVYLGRVDLVEYYAAYDEENYEKRWASFEEKYGKELTDAFKQLYAVYSADCIVWLANLYDPDICVCQDLYGEEECSGTKYCGTGGFYYSNSARDTLGYLPDVESTHQALNFLTSAGLDSSYLNIITDEMKQQIGDFVYALEEPNGYFYHPQWGIEFTDARLTRRGRDLSWSVGILSVLGRTPKYTTASGMKGEDVLGTSGRLTDKLGVGSVSAVSKVIATSDDAYASHLQDLDSFIAYLDSKDLRNNSYGVGSELSSQTSQIIARDKQIGTLDNPTPLADYLINWLNEGQNPETGHWDFKRPGEVGYRDYHGTNGLLKISGIYTNLGVEMPYAREAAMSAMADIVNPAEIGAVVDLYNTWFSLKNIINNLNECGGEEGAALAVEIRDELRAAAPDAIIVSRDKIKDFLKTDGSASYLRNQSSPTSQGCPSAVPGTNEGDVNGSTIAINGIIGNIAAALEISKPALFGKTERYLFKKTVENLSPITKVDDTSSPEPIDFDYEDTGAPSEELTVLAGNGGTANVVLDPTERSDGNVVHITSVSGAGDTIKIPVQNSSGLANSYIFEGDFYISEATSDYLLQLTIDACYMITFRLVTDESDPDYGRIRMVESSSSTGTVSIDRYLGVTVDKDSWFRIRMEYYYGSENDVRIKFYADTDLTDKEGVKLYAISDNYRDESGGKVNSGSSTPSKSFYISQIYVMRSASLDMYIDNLGCYVSKQSYSSVLGPNDDPYFNIDTEDREEVKYGFEDGSIHEDITVDSQDGSVYVTENNTLALGGSENLSSVSLPITVREAAAKCALGSFNLLVTDLEVGKEALIITGMDGKEKIFSLVLTGEEDEEGKYLSISPKNLTSDPPIDGARIPVGKSVVLSLEYYHLEDVILVYVDGEFVGASTKLHDEGNRRIMDSLMISTVKGSAVSAELDDIICEMNATLFVDAVAPDKPEKVYDFETDSDDVQLNGSGVAIQLTGGDKAAVMNSAVNKGSISVPVNVRSGVINSVVFKVDLDYLSLPENGDTHKISFADSDGNLICAFVISYDDKAIGLYEVGKGGRLTSPLYTFDADKTVSVDLEIFIGAKTVHVLRRAEVVAKSSVFVGEEYLDSDFSSVSIESLDAKSTVTVDELRCEALYKVYKSVKPAAVDNPETDFTAGLTFEHSSSGNLPSAIYTLTYGDNYTAIENIYNDLTEEYSNVLVLNKTGAGNDELAFVANLDNSEAASVVFEADIKLNITTAGCAYRIYFGSDNKGTSPMYLLQLCRNSANNVYLEDVSSASDGALSNYYDIGVKGGEWFNLRVELYEGDRETVRFKIYVNGALVGTSDNFNGKHNADATVNKLPKTMRLYCMGATRGAVYFDNVRMYSSDMTFENSVK